MTALDRLAGADAPSVRLVDTLARGLRRVSRRNFLVQTALAGSALAVDPKGYLLTPQSAYSRICGPSSSCSSGYTVFCCTVNNGVNACPPGTFTAGWWKAADSSWCCGGYRYIVDCNARCKSCRSGCGGDHICDSRCWSCSCKCGPSGSCDQRRHCCNAFRYGQCNTQVGCSGGVACRVVSCVPPYKWDNCTTTSLVDNATAEHNAPCLQGCGPILKKYNALGANGSYLGASTGPERSVGDDRGRFVTYQHGAIYWTKGTGAHAVHGAALTAWREVGGPRGWLGYPTRDRVDAKDGKGWVQRFQHGVVCDGPTTRVHVVWGSAYEKWADTGRETGPLGYPTRERATYADGWLQRFQHGSVCDSVRTRTASVWGSAYKQWTERGAQDGELGYPTADRVTAPDGTWVQTFEGGTLTG